MATKVLSPGGLGGARGGSLMNYRGNWSAVAYEVGDVVNYQGALYECASTVTPGSISVVGSSRTNSSYGAASNLPLPTGATAGMLLIVAEMLSTNGTATTLALPAGFTSSWASTGSDQNYALIYFSVGYKTLTATDITNGYVTVPANNQGAVISMATAVAGGTPEATVNTIVTNATGFAYSNITLPSFTYTTPGGLVLEMVADRSSGISGGITYPASNSNTYDGTNGTSSGWVRSTYANTAGGAVPAHAYTVGSPNYNQNVMAAIGVNLIASASFPTASFNKIVVPVPLGGTTGQALVKNSGTDNDFVWGSGVDTTATHYKGAWSSSNAYGLNDVVTYANSTYVCTTPVTTGSSPIIGALTAAGTSSNSSFRLNLPASATTGDTAIIGVSSYGGFTTPGGWTVVTSKQDANYDVFLRIYSYVLTSTDISNGYIQYTNTGTGYNYQAAAGWVTRGANIDTATISSSTTLTTASSTPANAGYLLDWVATNQSSATPPTQANLTGVNGICELSASVATGYETVSGGVATTPRTWVSSTASEYCTIVVPIYAASTFPTASFAKLADVARNAMGANTLTASSTLLASAGEYQRLNAASAAFDTTPPQTTQAGLRWTFKKVDSSANVPRLLGTFDGATNYSLSAQYKYVTIVTTTTAGVYEIIGNN